MNVSRRDSSARPAAALALLVMLIAATLAGPALATNATTKTKPPSAALRKLLSSHELWATVDVCSAPDQLNTVGVRGSMPGDGKAHDKMYMSFRLQYMDTATKLWVDLGTGATTALIPVGAGASARQDGSSFQLVPVAGKPAVTLRGVVDFQWRRGKTIVYSASRPTTAGHKSLAGADPKGYSAASCTIG